MRPLGQSTEPPGLHSAAQSRRRAAAGCPVVRSTVLPQAAVDVLALPVEVSQAGLADRPVGRGEDAGQGCQDRGCKRLAVLGEDQAPVAGQVVQH